MGDRARRTGSGLGPLGVDVDPLVVAGGVGEQVHLLLGDLDVVAVAEVLADELLQPGDALNGGGHADSMPTGLMRTVPSRSARADVSGTRSAGSSRLIGCSSSANERDRRTAPRCRSDRSSVDGAPVVDERAIEQRAGRRRRPSRSAHFCSLAMPSAGRTGDAGERPAMPQRPVDEEERCRTDSAEHGVEVEQEHRDLQGLGQRWVDPPVESAWLTVWQAWCWPPGRHAGSRPLTRCGPRRCARSGDVPLVDHAHRARRRAAVDRSRRGQRAPRPVAPLETAPRRVGSTCRSRRRAARHRRRARPPAALARRPAGAASTNADAGRRPTGTAFVDGWDGERSGCSCVHDADQATSAPLRYCGVALLPWPMVSGLAAEPSGLYEALAARVASDGGSTWSSHDGPFVDCGTPAGYLGPTCSASGGASVVGDAGRGRAAGSASSGPWSGRGPRSVAGEHLVDAIRATTASPCSFAERADARAVRRRARP